MKMSWGKKILFLYLSFVVLIIGMVSYTMTKNVDLVSPNYYDKEIKYQEQIDKINNTKSLKEGLKIIYSEGQINLVFPTLTKNGQVSGEINFYRPADSKKDFKVSINTENYKQVIRIDKMEKGLWKIQVNWKMNGIEYYTEETIII